MSSVFYAKYRLSQVILMRTDNNLCRKELMVHWSAPNSLIRSYLQPCTNSMWGDEREDVAPIIWLYQTVDAQKEEVFFPHLLITLRRHAFDDVIVHLFAVIISWTGLNRSEIPNGGIMMTSSNGNIFRVTGPLCGEFTGHRWIPLTKASDAELWCFLWSASWINGWVNNREAGDLRRNRAHYDVIAMYTRWNGNVVSLVKFSSSDVLEVVKMTTSNATRDENFRFS